MKWRCQCSSGTVWLKKWKEEQKWWASMGDVRKMKIQLLWGPTGWGSPAKKRASVVILRVAASMMDGWMNETATGKSRNAEKGASVRDRKRNFFSLTDWVSRDRTMRVLPTRQLEGCNQRRKQSGLEIRIWELLFPLQKHPTCVWVARVLTEMINHDWPESRCGTSLPFDWLRGEPCDLVLANETQRLLGRISFFHEEKTCFACISFLPACDLSGGNGIARAASWGVWQTRWWRQSRKMVKSLGTGSFVDLLNSLDLPTSRLLVTVRSLLFVC